MEQKTTLSQSIDIVEQKAQYDEACKKVLAEKIILAWIMKHTMKEYADYDITEIVGKFIVGDPKVAETKVMPDETNAPKIIGTGVDTLGVIPMSVSRFSSMEMIRSVQWVDKTMDMSRFPSS